MNQQENETVDYLMSDDENDEQDFFEFADLEPADEQLAEIKAGCQGCGIKFNHNETTAEDDESEAESLDDLPAPINSLPDLEPEVEVVGGALKGKPQHLVDSWTQHNETTAEDDEAETTEAIEDLPVEGDEQVKGGPGGYGSGGVLINHNETTTNDDEAEEGAEFDDLQVSDEQEEQVKGGPGGYGHGGILINHNETMNTDADE
ncbi:MAG: hypothetical protein AB7U82_01950 [Blastocatellales bacterium]